MKELNRGELQQITGGDGDTGGTTPATPDWSYCRGVSYSTFY